MSANENSLLLRIRGDSSGGTKAVQETRAAIAQLKNSSTADFKQIQANAGSSLGSITQTAGQLTQGIPVVGRAVSSLSAAFTSVTAATAGTATGFAAMAGPLSIAVAGIVATAAAVAALGKGLFDLAQSTATFQGKLFDLSQQVGVSVETLSALEVVARTTGSSVEQITASLGIFQKNMEAATDPTTKQAEAFKRLGVEVTTTEETFRATLTQLARMPEGFRQTALALELFGRGGKAILAILKETNGDIDEVTRRLGRLGLVTTEQARHADAFNDQLVILDVQLRGLGTKAIPVMTDALVSLSKTLEENRDLFEALQTVAKALSVLFVAPLKAAIFLVAEEWKKLQPIIELIAETYERIKQAIEYIIGHPISASTTGTPAAPATIAPTPKAEEQFTQQIQSEIQARKTLQGVLNAAFEDRRRQAEATIAFTQREFEAGRLTRQQSLDATIQASKKKTQAEIDALEVERRIKLLEAAEAKDDLQKRTQLSNAILAIDTQIANKRADLRRSVTDLTSKAALQERRELLTHEEAKLDILVRIGQDKIRLIEDSIKNETKTREEGLEEIENIENTSLATRGALLKRELAFAGVGPERQAALDKITALEAERTALEQAQRERRLRINTEADKRDLDQERRTFELHEAIRDGEQDRIKDALDRNEITESDSIKRRQNILKESHTERLRLIDLEIAKETSSVERIRELKAERAKIEQRFTDDFTRLSRERQEVIEKEIAANAPGAQGIPEVGPRVLSDEQIGEIGEVPDQPIRNLTQAFDELGLSIAEAVGLSGDFAKQVSRDFGDILNSGFQELSAGIGEMVRNYVLLGETGPAALKKVLAASLATIAAESAQKAIYYTAMGIASLFVNPAAAGGYFTAAALFAGLAAGAAVAGRAIAGDSFKKPDRGGRDGGSSSPDQLNPLTMGRNQPQPLRIIIQQDIRHEEGIIVKTWANDFRNGGITREVTHEDGGV